MIVIYEKFVKVWTNCSNLIKNFKSFKDNFENFEEILIIIRKNLTKIWNFSTIDSYSFSSKNICVRGGEVPLVYPSGAATRAKNKC